VIGKNKSITALNEILDLKNKLKTLEENNQKLLEKNNLLEKRVHHFEKLENRIKQLEDVNHILYVDSPPQLESPPIVTPLLSAQQSSGSKSAEKTNNEEFIQNVKKRKIIESDELDLNKKQKLNNPEGSKIFDGMHMTQLGGYEGREEQKQFIVQQGGEIISYITTALKFVITTQEEVNRKYSKLFDAKRHKIPLVSQEFIAQCKKSNTLVDYKEFQLKYPERDFESTDEPKKEEEEEW